MNDKKSAGVDPDLVRELAKILGESGLSEIEVEHGPMKLRLSRNVSVSVAPPAPVHQVNYAAPTVAPIEPVATPAQTAANHPGMVPSPMVGTAYLSPEPGAAPFVKIGDAVTAGQTIMVVEAMKTFNPIPAPRAGKVTAILVTDAQPVEYGEALVILE
jgi:acetyl-CoA carboxylase biotin carboxyl carrier protein